MTRDERIAENLRLVHTCARRFRGKGIDYDDLYAAGCLGLVKAAENFDEQLGFRFSTYAVPVILGEIKRLFRDGGSVKVSRSLKELSLRVAAERDRCRDECGGEPGVEMIAERLNTDPARVAEAILCSAPAISLSPDDDGRVIEIPVEEPQERLFERLSLEQVMDTLSGEEQRLIRLRYYAQDPVRDRPHPRYHPGTDLAPRKKDPAEAAVGARVVAQNRKQFCHGM